MKKINNIIYSNPKQAVLPMLIKDYLDICDPVLTFDRFMGEIELEKYLKNIPQHYTGRLIYDPVSMLKTVLFGLWRMAIYHYVNWRISVKSISASCILWIIKHLLTVLSATSSTKYLLIPLRKYFKI